ncbi:hypothetical protein V8C86DRAFT_735953 [Haematococcus lacustris]
MTPNISISMSSEVALWHCGTVVNRGLWHCGTVAPALQHAAAEDKPQLAIWLLSVEPPSVAAVLVFFALRFFRCGCSALALLLMAATIARVVCTGASRFCLLAAARLLLTSRYDLTGGSTRHFQMFSEYVQIFR